MQAPDHIGAGRLDQHVSRSQEKLRSPGVQDDPGVYLAPHLEGDLGGDVGLDEAGDHLGGGPLSGEDEVDPGGPGHLCQADDGRFDLFFLGQHQIGQLVDHHHDIGEDLLRRNDLAIFGNVLDSLVLHQVIAPKHLCDQGPQTAHGDRRLGDHRAEQVGDALVWGHLQALGVDHEKTDILRAVFHEKA